VDGNRNFDFHWAEIGSSNNPCSETYHGPKAFSEKETQAVRKAVQRVKNRLAIYISIHSYGPYILYPFGHNKTLTPDSADMVSTFHRDYSSAIPRECCYPLIQQKVDFRM